MTRDARRDFRDVSPNTGDQCCCIVRCGVSCQGAASAVGALGCGCSVVLVGLLERGSREGQARQGCLSHCKPSSAPLAPLAALKASPSMDASIPTVSRPGIPSGLLQGSSIPSGLLQGSSIPSGLLQGSSIPSGLLQGSGIPSGLLQGHPV